jgi:hypothetical protein
MLNIVVQVFFVAIKYVITVWSLKYDDMILKVLTSYAYYSTLMQKTLFSSKESLISLMRDVELQEKAAEQANMEAGRGGSDILDRVEEYKAMLVHAKEANDMVWNEINNKYYRC